MYEIQTSNVTGHQRGAKRKRSSARSFASTWRPLVSANTPLYYVAISFHRRVWYRALSLRCVCIRSSGIIIIPKATSVPNLVSVAPSIAELAHGENRVLSQSSS